MAAKRRGLKLQIFIAAITLHHTELSTSPLLLHTIKGMNLNAQQISLIVSRVPWGGKCCEHPENQQESCSVSGQEDELKGMRGKRGVNRK